MTRSQLEHLIRASADITGHYEFIVVGSQSILGPIPNPEDAFTASAEADIYPMHAPELANQIDGAIGEDSQFHATYGYYAQGVGPETAVLPAGWLERVHRVQGPETNGRVGCCLDPVDPFLSKTAAGRPKDRDFCIALLAYGHVRISSALVLLDAMPLDKPQQQRLRATILRWAKQASRNDA